MTSLFPSPERAQPAVDRDVVPAEVQMDFSQLLDWFTPNVFVSWIILAINILVFAAMLMMGFNPDKASSQVLLKWGADFGPATIGQREWWRVVTSEFVHLGFVHLAFNMYVLFQIGPFTERLLGNAGFLLVYLVSGVAGALCSLTWNPYVISAGASGAIFGLYGALIGFLVLRRDSIPGPVLKRLLQSAIIFLAYNGVFGVLHAGTDLAAHGGGLAGGLLCGLLISTPLNAGFPKRRLLRAAAASVGCAAVLLAIAARLPRPIDFMAEIRKFDAVEKPALTSFDALMHQVKWSQAADVTARLQKDVISPWNAERQSLAKLTGLPKKQQDLVALLLTYMDARRQGWTDLAQGLRTHDAALVKRSFGEQTEAQSKLKARLADSR